MGALESLQRNQLYWIKSHDLERLALEKTYPAVDVGRLIAGELTRNPPGKHVALDTDEFLKKELRSRIAVQPGPNRGLILSNLGILLEPDLELNPEKLFLELSLDAVVILVWDAAIVDGKSFVWDEAKPDYGFSFPSHTITNMELRDEVQ
jgi:hypothetical protein